MTKIAGNRTCCDWYAFKDRLQKEPSPELWEQAFEEYFMERLCSRYFKPIELLLTWDTKTGEGFSIMAILCTLIEFLESTARGSKYKDVKDKDLKKFEYNKSRQIFIYFLSKHKPFSDHFDEGLAFEFYKNVRCGLLHEAQTKGGWKIRVIPSNRTIVNMDNKIVDRDNFKEALYTYIDDYGKKLRTDRDLQEAFIRKFDFICEETS